MNSYPRQALLAMAVAVSFACAPVAAQDMHHGMQMQMPMPMPPPAARKPSKPAHEPVAPYKRRARPSTAPAREQPSPGMTMDHATMDHGTMDHGTMDHGTMDHATMDHATMDHATMDHPPQLPRTPIPVPTAADRAAAVPPPGDHPVHDNGVQHSILFDRFEGWDADRGTGAAWEARTWIGTDLDRLWLRTEGERLGGRTERSDLEVLYGRSVSPWWDVLVGVRHDFRPGPAQDFVAFGVTGLAPYKVEVAATAYVGASGRTAMRLEAEYETLLTNRLILQPLVEANLYGKDDLERGTGAGLSTLEAGVRLRYEITRRFAPYVGIVRERAFGRTAEARRAEGDTADDTRVVAGIRFWF